MPPGQGACSFRASLILLILSLSKPRLSAGFGFFGQKQTAGLIIFALTARCDDMNGLSKSFALLFDSDFDLACQAPHDSFSVEHIWKISNVQAKHNSGPDFLVSNSGKRHISLKVGCTQHTPSCESLTEVFGLQIHS